MEALQSTLANATLFDMVTIFSPAVAVLGYMVYSCCSRQKEEQPIVIETRYYDEVNEKNSKLALMLMMLLTVEPGLNRKYSNLAHTIGCNHIMNADRVEEDAAESDTE